MNEYQARHFCPDGKGAVGVPPRKETKSFLECLDPDASIPFKQYIAVPIIVPSPTCATTRCSWP
jgi:hypothetical protein